jgi:hypothetical protein
MWADWFSVWPALRFEVFACLKFVMERHIQSISLIITHRPKPEKGGAVLTPLRSLSRERQKLTMCNAKAMYSVHGRSDRICADGENVRFKRLRYILELRPRPCDARRRHRGIKQSAAG